MCCCNVQLKYTGSVPGADGNTYVLFSTVAAGWPARAAALFCANKFVLMLKNPQAGTLNAYSSPDRGATWNQVDTTAIAAAAATASNPYELLIEMLPDFKLEWVNGGAAQTGWEVEMSIVDQRAVA